MFALSIRIRLVSEESFSRDLVPAAPWLSPGPMPVVPRVSACHDSSEDRALHRAGDEAVEESRSLVEEARGDRCSSPHHGGQASSCDRVRLHDHQAQEQRHSLAGDPLQDVRKLEGVKFVMKGGHIVKNDYEK